MKSPLVLPTLLALLLGAQPMHARTQEEKDALVAAVGSTAGEALFSVHFAVNALAENWQKNVYADFQAKELAESYKGSAEKVLGLVKGKSAKIEEGAESLLKQATVLEAWIQTKEDSLADSYRKLKDQADAALFPAAAAGSADAPPSVPDSDTASADPVEAEIREIAEDIRDDLAKLAKYKPTLDQIKAIVFTTVGAERMHQYVEAGFGQLPSGRPAAKPGQTEILVEGPDLGDLPGGYAQAIDHFKPGVKIYGFKYVEPGSTLGTSFDALFKVDGKWFFIPKAWRVFARPTSPAQP